MHKSSVRRIFCYFFIIIIHKLYIRIQNQHHKWKFESNVYTFFIHIMSYLGFRGSPPKRLEVLGGSRLFFSSSSEVNHFKLLFCKRSILSILVVQVSQEVDIFIFSTFQFPNVRFVRKFLETELSTDFWRIESVTFPKM